MNKIENSIPVPRELIGDNCGLIYRVIGNTNYKFPKNITKKTKRKSKGFI